MITKRAARRTEGFASALAATSAPTPAGSPSVMPIGLLLDLDIGLFLELAEPLLKTFLEFLAIQQVVDLTLDLSKFSHLGGDLAFELEDKYALVRLDGIGNLSLRQAKNDLFDIGKELPFFNDTDG